MKCHLIFHEFWFCFRSRDFVYLFILMMFHQHDGNKFLHIVRIEFCTTSRKIKKPHLNKLERLNGISIWTECVLWMGQWTTIVILCTLIECQMFSYWLFVIFNRFNWKFTLIITTNCLEIDDKPFTTCHVWSHHFRMSRQKLWKQTKVWCLNSHCPNNLSVLYRIRDVFYLYYQIWIRHSGSLMFFFSLSVE